MANPLADIELGLTVLADLKVALPVLGQAVADLKQAIADKADPTKAAQDVANALELVGPLLNKFLPTPQASGPAK